MSTERTATRDVVVNMVPPDVTWYGFKYSKPGMAGWDLHVYASPQTRDGWMIQFVEVGYVCVPFTLPGETGATS